MRKKKTTPVESRPGPEDATITITMNIPVHNEKAWTRAARMLAGALSALEPAEQRSISYRLHEYIETLGRNARVAADWPREFSREHIRNWIEEATGGGLSVDDPLPDTLAATAQALGLQPFQLRIWVWEQPKAEWSGAALERWARARGFALCAHCGAPVQDPQEHQCPPAAEREPVQ